ncbi:MAG: hypothetical protein U0V48_17290 [Anaerolineales bacterium]
MKISPFGARRNESRASILTLRGFLPVGGLAITLTCIPIGNVGVKVDVGEIGVKVKVGINGSVGNKVDVYVSVKKGLGIGVSGGRVSVGAVVFVGMGVGDGVESNIRINGGKFKSPTITTPNVVIMATHI